MALDIESLFDNGKALRSLGSIERFVENKAVKTVKTVKSTNPNYSLSFVATLFVDGSILIMRLKGEWTDPETGTWWNAEIDFAGATADVAQGIGSR